MTINADLNRYAWYAVGAMLVIYLILVLEDLVEAMRRRDVLVMRVYEGDLKGARVVENDPQEPLTIPPLASANKAEEDDRSWLEKSIDAIDNMDT